MALMLMIVIKIKIAIIITNALILLFDQMLCVPQLYFNDYYLISFIIYSIKTSIDDVQTKVPYESIVFPTKGLFEM